MDVKDLPDDIEAFIEATLKSEPMRAVPITLHRRVEERLRIAGKLEQERVRFRYTMATMLIAFLASLGGGASILAFTNLRGLVNHGVPGQGGLYDYYASAMSASFIG